MINRQYIANVEVVKKGKLIKWGTHSFAMRSWFPKCAGGVADFIRYEMADYFGCLSSDVRIVGVFKL